MLCVIVPIVHVRALREVNSALLRVVGPAKPRDAAQQVGLEVVLLLLPREGVAHQHGAGNALGLASAGMCYSVVLPLGPTRAIVAY